MFDLSCHWLDLKLMKIKIHGEEMRSQTFIFRTNSSGFTRIWTIVSVKKKNYPQTDRYDTEFNLMRSLGEDSFGDRCMEVLLKSN